MEQVIVRLPEDLIARAEKLIERVEMRSDLRAIAGRITRSTVLRMALGRGLDVLEEELPHPGSAPSTRKPKPR